jgi:hypothetical protein
VDPSFTLVLNTGNDNHPESDIRNGDALLARVYHAVATSPAWNSTVLVMNYDEWGGFFDHVPPPRALAPNHTDTDLVNGKALLGCRCPCIVASPWTVGTPSNPTVDHTVFDHTSVLKMIESVFNVAPLAAREISSDVGNMLTAINLGNSPLGAPSLPQPQQVVPQTICSSSISPGTAGPLVRTDDESRSFMRLHQTARERGWPVNGIVAGRTGALRLSFSLPIPSARRERDPPLRVKLLRHRHIQCIERHRVQSAATGIVQIPVFHPVIAHQIHPPVPQRQDRLSCLRGLVRPKARKPGCSNTGALLLPGH